MKKPYKFDQVSSDVRCSICHKPLKLNVIDRKNNPKLCYKCSKKKESYKHEDYK